MVTMFGMSETFGIMGLATVRNQYLEGSYSLDCAQETAAKVDKEVQQILNTCYEESKAILRENRELMDRIAEYLLKKETITGQEMMAIIEGRDPELVDNYGTNPRFNANIHADGIEPAARKIHILSEPVTPPALEEDNEEEEPEAPESPDAPDQDTSNTENAE
jgi:cell division protease FtsH